MNHFIVASAEKCIGCYTCEVACAVVHAGTPALAAQHYFPRLKVIKQKHISVPVMCRQCENAPCVAACPVAALQKGEQAVEAVNGRCIDCKSCVIACPFGAIEIVSRPDLAGQWEPVIIKCDLCVGQAAGPTCVNVCPTGALSCMTPAELNQQRQTKQRRVANPISLTASSLIEGVNHG